jgi:hypothetical protein
VAQTASQVYSSNLGNFVAHFWGKESNSFCLKLEDEIMKGALIVLGQKSFRRHFRKAEDTQHGGRDEGKPDYRNAHQPCHGGAVGVPDAVDETHDGADNAVPRRDKPANGAAYDVSALIADRNIATALSRQTAGQLARRG